MMKEKPYLLFIFYLDPWWYGLIRTVSMNKRKGKTYWSKKRILGRNMISVGIRDKTPESISIKDEEILWETEIELTTNELGQRISDRNSQSLSLKYKLMYESTRENTEG